MPGARKNLKGKGKGKGKGTFKGKGRGKPGGRKLFLRKKNCKFCADKVKKIDYKDAGRLERLTTERGKILPSRISGTCAKHQRQLANAIMRARVIALLPYIAGYK